MSHELRTSAPNAAKKGTPPGALYAVVAAVAMFSGALVMLQLSGPPPGRAATAAAAPSTPTSSRAAKTWDLEPRWWPGTHVEPGSMQQRERPAPTAPPTGRTAVAESDLTFAAGYAVRLAARRAAAAELVAAPVPSTEGKTGSHIARSHRVVHHANATPRTTAVPTAHRLTPAVAARAEPAASDIGSHALAFDEPRPGQGIFPQPGPFPSMVSALR